MTEEHNLLQRDIVVFEAHPDDAGRRPRYVAFLSDGAGFLPILFRANERHDAWQAADDWRVDEVEKAERERALKERRAAERAGGRR